MSAQGDTVLLETRLPRTQFDGGGPETIAWIRTARVISAFAVVLLHCVAHTVNTGQLHDRGAWLLAVALESGVRWCVPVFVMLSGFLLLAPARSREPASHFYRRRASRIVVPTIAWTVIYIMFMWVKSRHQIPPYTASDALTSIAQGIPFYHMWYMFMIACLYGITPLLRRVTAPLTERQFAFVGALCLAVAVIVVTAFDKAGVNGKPVFLLVFPYYIGYFILGRTIGDGFARIPMPIFVVGASVAITAVLTATTGSTYFFEYLSISVVPMSLAMFTLLQCFHMKTVDWISDYTLGIYLCHPIFIMIANASFDKFPAIPAIIVFVGKTLFAFFASLGFVWALKRVPFFRRIV